MYRRMKDDSSTAPVSIAVSSFGTVVGRSWDSAFAFLLAGSKAFSASRVFKASKIFRLAV